ncbi:MAG: hypothetical protein SFW62_10020 [Alphaproteobacteria bacterium]|nr:hypothetical protein [Alphaproteobacteria bacterium]
MTLRTQFKTINAVTMDQRQSLIQAVMAMTVALLILGVHAVLGTGFGSPGFIWLIAMTLLAVLLSAEVSFALLMGCFFLQNAFIALAAANIQDFDDFRLLLGTGFLNIFFTSLICFPVWLKLRGRFPKENLPLLRWMFFFFVVVGFYAVLGLLQVNLSSVLVYVRVYLTGGLLLAIGLAFGFRLRLGYVINIIRLLALILVTWGLVEFFWTYDLYSFFNAADFMRLKFSTASAETEVFDNVMDVINHSSGNYLNLSGMMGLDFRILRPNGPIFHPISYAYDLVFCCIVCFIYRFYFLAFFCFVIATLVGAKGPLIMLLVCFGLYMLYIRTRNRAWVLTALLACMIGYAVVGIAYGLSTRDFHVMGFLGGIKGFLMNPAGHGIGVGGTLSSKGLNETTSGLQFFQNFGANFGFESAFGVAFYQMGIGTIVLFFFYWYLWKAVWKSSLYFVSEPRLTLIPLALAILFVNGIFQEEALSPAGWGLWLLLSGVLVARHWQAEMPKDPASAKIGVTTKLKAP